MTQEDFAAREHGKQAQMALEVVEGLIEARGEATLAEAEAAYFDGKLTPERAYTLLVTLLEQRRLLLTLERDADQGVAAARRIQKSMDAQTEAVAAETVVSLRGRNRFMPGGSRRPPPVKPGA